MTFTYWPLVPATDNQMRLWRAVYLASRWRTQTLPAFLARNYSSTLTRIIKHIQKVVSKKLGVDSSIWGELFWLSLTKDSLGRTRNDAWTRFILVLLFIALGGFYYGSLNLFSLFIFYFLAQITNLRTFSRQYHLCMCCTDGFSPSSSGHHGRIR